MKLNKRDEVDDVVCCSSELLFGVKSSQSFFSRLIQVFQRRRDFKDRKQWRLYDETMMMYHSIVCDSVLDLLGDLIIKT